MFLHRISKDGIRGQGFGYDPNIIKLSLPFIGLLQSLIGINLLNIPAKKGPGDDLNIKGKKG